MDLLYISFGMIIDIGPKFYSALFPPYDLDVTVADRNFFDWQIRVQAS